MEGYTEQTRGVIRAHFITWKLAPGVKVHFFIDSISAHHVTVQLHAQKYLRSDGTETTHFVICQLFLKLLSTYW